MGRTRLRGISLAGMQLAVESPPEFAWDWPERGLGALSCAPSDPEVYVGVTVGSVAAPDWDPITYALEGGTFDVGRVGDEWWIATHRAGTRFERVARFDRSFSEGVVHVSPAAVERCRHPLEGPLLDLMLIHRIIAGGGLVLSGSAVIDQGSALAILSAEDERIDPTRPGMQAWLRKDAPGTAQTPGTRFGVRWRDGMPRVYGLPGAHGHPDAALTARLSAVHILTRSDQVSADPVAREDATHELVQHACAPLHAPEVAEPLLDAAETLGAAIPMLRLGVPIEQRVVPVDWGRRESALGFARPVLG